MRGWIFSSASLWIGSPVFFISIVMTALLVPGWPSTFLTTPTLTPAIRTGEFSRIEFADGKTALNSKPRWNGRSFVNPKYEISDHADQHENADGDRVAARAVLAQGARALALGCAAERHYGVGLVL